MQHLRSKQDALVVKRLEAMSSPDSPRTLDELRRLDWYDTTVIGTNQTAALALPGLLILGIAAPLTVCALAAISAVMYADFEVAGAVALAGCIASVSVGPIAMLVAFWISSSILAGLNAAMGLPFKARTQLAIVGGLASYIPGTAAFFVIAPLEGQALETFALCSGFMVLCGQQLAIWSGRREIRNTRLPDQPRSFQGAGQQLQFRLPHLFSTVAVLAIYLALDRLLSFRLSLFAVLYCFLQFLTWALDRICITLVRWFWTTPTRHKSSEP